MILSCLVAAVAAAELGTIVVVPVDDAGNVWALDSATAEFTRGDESVAASFTSDGLVAQLATGTWTVRVTAPHFVSARQQVEVRSATTRVELVLEPSFEGAEQVVVEERSEASELRRSAQAVTVIETDDAQKHAADLGEVMARTEGIGIRRTGGLGSDTRFSLDGLTDDQIRFFLDGLPLEASGYPFGISNVPVDLVQRIEVYRGVVPIRFGADALGGAVNLVSEQEGDAASLGYQVGSYDTHRIAGHARAASEATGLFVDGAAYYDTSKNDYEIEVEVPDDVGRLSVETVERFHDAYRAGGGALVLGVQDRAWTDQLSLRGFASTFYDEIQHNVVMTVPYGEPTYEVDTVGSTLRYEHTPGTFSIDVAASYARANRSFVDLADCVYDWYGECVADRSTPGEITTPGSDQDVWDDSALGRASVAWQSSPHHRWTLSTAPTLFSRTGKNHLLDPEDRDSLTAQRDSFTLVSGAEHTLTAGPIENQAFGKHYLQEIRSEEPAVGAEGFRRADRTTKRWGVGDGIRWSLAEWMWFKGSYEFATRLPNPEEVFGDAALVLDNLDLVPETSHNANVSVSIEATDTKQGDIVLDVAGFLRNARDLIVLLGSDRVFQYQNAYSARSIGMSGAAGWTSPGDWVSLDLNGTWIDLRNTSTEGTFEDFQGDRIPNRPYLYANAGLEVGWSDLAIDGDRLGVSGWSRWVGEFYRGWESVGLEAYKQSVPAQLSHTAALTYTLDLDRNAASASFEVDNLTDAKLYDFFGVQKPGRAFYLKVTLTRKPT